MTFFSSGICSLNGAVILTTSYWRLRHQDELILRKSSSAEAVLEDNDQTVLADRGCNADLYIANQEDVYD